MRGWCGVALRLASAAPLSLMACESGTAPHALRIEAMNSLPSGPLTQGVRITLRDAAPLTVKYGSADGPRLSIESPAARQHDLLFARLRPGRVYTATIAGTRDTFSFATDTLPSDLAGIRIAALGTAGMPLFLVHLFAPDGFRGHAIVDASGSIVWYRRTADYPFGVARRANGNFVIMDRGRGLVEVTPGGSEVYALPQDPAAVSCTTT